MVNTGKSMHVTRDVQTCTCPRYTMYTTRYFLGEPVRKVTNVNARNAHPMRIEQHPNPMRIQCASFQR